MILDSKTVNSIYLDRISISSASGIEVFFTRYFHRDWVSISHCTLCGLEKPLFSHPLQQKGSQFHIKMEGYEIKILSTYL